MKKLIILKLMLLSFIATNLQAELQLDKFYLGVSYSSGSGEIEQENTSITNVDFDSTAKSFKIGYMLENEDRVVVSYEILTKELESGYTWYGKTEPEIRGINWDALFTMPINKHLTPYLSVGLGSYSLEDSAKYYVEEYDLSALSFNYGVGFFYTIDFIEIELSYNGKYLSWADVESNNVTTSTTTSLSYFTVGLNIHF